jgi:uracil-DNA glycosylase
MWSYLVLSVINMSANFFFFLTRSGTRKRVFWSAFSPVLTMDGTQSVVYLEDVEPTRKVAKREDNDASGSVNSSASKPATTAAVKRQRTLVDMFGSSQEDTSSSKKPRLSASKSGSSVSSTKTSNIGSTSNLKGFGLQRLNSIPFSITSFQESLSEEQKKLLRLECEVMGKSW